MVVLHHSHGSFAFYHHVDLPFFDFLAHIGKYGVDFFFVLSGFIISYSNFEKAGNKKFISTYLKSRFIRIYVPYLPIGIGMVLLYSNFSSLSNSSRNISLFTSITLLPNGLPALSVAWTLVHELLFYFVFVLYMFSKRTWNIFVIIWVFFIIYFNYFTQTHTWSNSFFRVLLSPYNLEFIVGYFISLIIKSNVKIKPAYLVILSVLMFTCFLYCKYFGIEGFSFFLNYFFALFCALSIYLSIQISSLNISKKNIFMLIGNSAYSIYLVHNPVQALIIRLLPKFEHSLLCLIIEIFVVFATCIVIGYLYFLVFEKILMSKLKNL